MKTVPTLRVVSKSDASAELDELGVDDLPAEVRLALTEIVGAARDGLLAMSVAAGMAVDAGDAGGGGQRGVRGRRVRVQIRNQACDLGVVRVAGSHHPDMPTSTTINTRPG